ncbi:MAG: cation:proton antiporter [Methanomassiliicoccales archaeon]|nr:MAG: cation:proton antiporter [Methanomassiliicoccales archaeon]
MTPDVIFLVLGLSIILGFMADYLFQRIGFPDVLLLILLGFILGPGLAGIVSGSLTDNIMEITPYVAGVALAIILFDAGLGLDLGMVFGSLRHAVLHTLLEFFLSIVIVAVIASVLLGWDLILGLTLGTIIGGTSGAIVIPMVKRMRMTDKARTILTLEAAITDVLVIVIAIFLIFLMREQSASALDAVRVLILSFLLSIAIGGGAGILWIKALARLQGRPLAYMITLGVVFVIYSITNMIIGESGGGAIAALVFGLVLGNRHEVVTRLGMVEEVIEIGRDIIKLNQEITFFVRTFFFVYLGLFFGTIALGKGDILFSIVIFAGLFFVRWLGVMVERKSLGMNGHDPIGYVVMMPRGLSAAVLASLPLTSGAVSVEDGNLIVGITVMIILYTTIGASVGAFVLSRLGRRS